MEEEEVTQSYYAILGVANEASEQEIRKAYLKKAAVTHPDRHPDNQDEATKEFQLINEAYETLSNQDLKAEYDIKLSLEARGIKVPKKPHPNSGAAMNTNINTTWPEGFAFTRPPAPVPMGFGYGYGFGFGGMGGPSVGGGGFGNGFDNGTGNGFGIGANGSNGPSGPPHFGGKPFGKPGYPAPYGYPGRPPPRNFAESMNMRMDEDQDEEKEKENENENKNDKVKEKKGHEKEAADDKEKKNDNNKSKDKDQNQDKVFHADKDESMDFDQNKEEGLKEDEGMGDSSDEEDNKKNENEGEKTPDWGSSPQGASWTSTKGTRHWPKPPFRRPGAGVGDGAGFSPPGYSPYPNMNTFDSHRHSHFPPRPNMFRQPLNGMHFPMPQATNGGYPGRSMPMPMPGSVPLPSHTLPRRPPVARPGMPFTPPFAHTRGHGRNASIPSPPLAPFFRSPTGIPTPSSPPIPNNNFPPGHPLSNPFSNLGNQHQHLGNHGFPTPPSPDLFRKQAQAQQRTMQAHMHLQEQVLLERKLHAERAASILGAAEADMRYNREKMSREYARAGNGNNFRSDMGIPSFGLGGMGDHSPPSGMNTFHGMDGMGMGKGVSMSGMGGIGRFGLRVPAGLRNDRLGDFHDEVEADGWTNDDGDSGHQSSPIQQHQQEQQQTRQRACPPQQINEQPVNNSYSDVHNRHSIIRNREERESVGECNSNTPPVFTSLPPEPEFVLRPETPSWESSTPELEPTESELEYLAEGDFSAFPEGGRETPPHMRSAKNKALFDKSWLGNGIDEDNWTGGGVEDEDGKPKPKPTTLPTTSWDTFYSKQEERATLRQNQAAAYSFEALEAKKEAAIQLAKEKAALWEKKRKDEEEEALKGCDTTSEGVITSQVAKDTGLSTKEPVVRFEDSIQSGQNSDGISLDNVKDWTTEMENDYSLTKRKNHALPRKPYSPSTTQLTPSIRLSPPTDHHSDGEKIQKSSAMLDTTLVLDRLLTAMNLTAAQVMAMTEEGGIGTFLKEITAIKSGSSEWRRKTSTDPTENETIAMTHKSDSETSCDIALDIPSAPPTPEPPKPVLPPKTKFKTKKAYYRHTEGW